MDKVQSYLDRLGDERPHTRQKGRETMNKKLTAAVPSTALVKAVDDAAIIPLTKENIVKLVNPLRPRPRRLRSSSTSAPCST